MKMRFVALTVCFCMALPLLADTIILRDGTSYTGQLEVGTNVTFTDSQGIQYQFPRRDVQSLVLTPSSDTVTLRSGKSYSGHFTGPAVMSFAGSQGIHYRFPGRDVESVVFNSAAAPVAVPQNAKVIPIDSELSVHTNENIDSLNSQPGQLYSASITENVEDTAANVAIPAGSRAQLLVRKISTGGAVHSPELVLDLYSITIHGREYRVVSSNVDRSNGKGLGANRRTAEFAGGGAALGALLGGIFGGGRGAGIGALAGGGGGAVTQLFTRGKQVKVPAEAILRFRLERTLVLQPH